ncbi:2-oxo-4-hydroxy-4-carboxy-5-ureidoimidazoline decarboxylase [Nocardia crassostreae]|uniref:2-oxo-4-hydroxy-4-carboxy-5-ureidoimidazoline decarboxylase n=1 Tax=Nocardia crassostreae TaxID=53428 RepID=UPI000836C24C|nr:2-oxo-4-hydroxy-4-carboxy-5-ureidoimidazoline decarboxylase [Nocardia crassostreae]
MVTIAEFNEVDNGVIQPDLLACCDVATWADALLAARPYPDLGALLDTADRLVETFPPECVDRAAAVQSRMGERPGIATDGVTVAAVDATDMALCAANRHYERRFGRVCVMCATGLTAAEILVAIVLRLGNDVATETAVVRTELRKIARLRLQQVIVQTPVADRTSCP